MTFLKMEQACKAGHWGMFPGYDGYFKWNYGYKKLDFENLNHERFLATELKDWESIKNSNEFLYII